MATTTQTKTRRPRPIREAIGAVSNTIGAGASVLNTLVDIAQISLKDVKRSVELDDFESETDYLVDMKIAQARRAELA